MKHISLGILGICIALAGIAFSTYNVIAWIGGGIGLIVSAAAYVGASKN